MVLKYLRWIQSSILCNLIPHEHLIPQQKKNAHQVLDS